ncbi:MAG: Uma2 family endonuclease [Planctomycetota bacterium]|nr:Uma2 family endonuclease [Planctomycetota bacterium]
MISWGNCPLTVAIDPELLQLGPDANGSLLTPAEFDAAEFEEGWRYELIRGVLIVSPAPSREERDPNGELEWLLRDYHPAVARLRIGAGSVAATRRPLGALTRIFHKDRNPC